MSARTHKNRIRSSSSVTGTRRNSSQSPTAAVALRNVRKVSDLKQWAMHYPTQFASALKASGVARKFKRLTSRKHIHNDA